MNGKKKKLCFKINLENFFPYPITAVGFKFTTD